MSIMIVRKYVLSVFVLLSVYFPAENVSATSDFGSTTLHTGQVIQRTLSGGESHSYTFTAHEPGYWVVHVRQKHINTELVVSSDGQPKITVDSPTGRDGIDTVVFQTYGNSGVLIVVRASSRFVQGGHYEIFVNELTQGSTLDIQYRKAMQRLMEGDEQYRLEHETAYNNAVESYQEAAELAQSLTDRDLEARIAYSRAMGLRAVGDIDAALSSSREAVRLYQSIGDKEMLGWGFDELGLSYLYQSNYAQASHNFQKAQETFVATGNEVGSAIVQNNMCLTQHYRGDYSSALNCYRPLLGLLETMGELAYLAFLHNNVGRVLDIIGDPIAARGHLTQAIRLFEQVDDRSGQGQALNNLGLLERRLGNLQDAIKAYDQALKLQKALGNKLEQATLLHNIGLAYHYLGDEKRGLRYLERALPLRQQVGDLRGEASTANGLGSVLLRLGRGAEAAKQYRRSIDLRMRIDDKPGQARALLRLGESLAANGDRIGALHHINRAHELLVNAGDKRYVAESLFQRAKVAAIDDPGAANSDLREAHQLWASMNDPLGPPRATLELAKLALSQDRIDEALSWLDDSIGQSNAVRRRILAPTLRSTFLSVRQDAFRSKIEVLMRLHRLNPEQHFDRSALIVNDGRLAGSLADLMFERNLTLGSDSGDETVGELRDLRDRVSAEAAQLSRSAASDAAPAKIEAQRRKLDDLLAGLEAVEGNSQGSRSRLATLREPREMNIGEVQKALDGNTLVLHLYVGEDSGHVWAIDDREIHSYRIPSRSKIDGLVRESYADLSRLVVGDDCNGLSHVSELSNVLLQPIAERLARYSRLIIVADGSLAYIPFSVLPSPGTDTSGPFGCQQPLVASHEVRHAPSLAVWSMARKATRAPGRSAAQIAVFSDPVYAADDQRLRHLSPVPRQFSDNLTIADESNPPPLQRLRWSATEADAILGAAGQTRVRLFTGFEAIKARLLHRDMVDYDIIHLAVHGLYDTESPDLTSLVFTQYGSSGNFVDGYLTLQDVLGMNLRSELLVLSGCDTALGERIGGEGLLGITRAMMYAGANQVVASLWSVDDAATAALMSHFYQALIVDQLSPPAALRRAQLLLLSTPRWRDPFYWGGFVIQGEPFAK